MADGISPSGLPAVYQAIAAVMEDVGREGIAKGRRNQQQGYSFRGIDDVYNALAPILARHHLIIVPRVLTREKTEQTTAKGGILFYVVVQVEFDIVCAVDGSRITACTWGEAMDSADKATNKAMSAAYKYMAMQTFCIPTEGDNDADVVTHQVVARKPAHVSPPTPRGQLVAPENAGQREQSPEPPPSHNANEDGEEVDQTTQPEWPLLEAEMDACRTREALKEWWTTPEKKALKQRKPHLARAFYRFAYTPRWEELGEMVVYEDAGDRG